jgi:hypothetical protein
VHPLLSARLAAWATDGALALLVLRPAAALFARTAGVTSDVAGHAAAGAVRRPWVWRAAGWLMMPKVAQATAPFLFGLALDRWGASTLWLSAGLGVSALVALMLMPAIRPAAQS